MENANYDQHPIVMSFQHLLLASQGLLDVLDKNLSLLEYQEDPALIDAVARMLGGLDDANSPRHVFGRLAKSARQAMRLGAEKTSSLWSEENRMRRARRSRWDARRDAIEAPGGWVPGVALLRSLYRQLDRPFAWQHVERGTDTSFWKMSIPRALGDCYLLCLTEGQGIDWHCDLLPDNIPGGVLRLNVIVVAPKQGGVFEVKDPECLVRFGPRVNLFRPDETFHRVTPVGSGETRWVFSLGFWLPGPLVADMVLTHPQARGVEFLAASLMSGLLLHEVRRQVRWRAA